jgi:phosphate transport system permease protein
MTVHDAVGQSDKVGAVSPSASAPEPPDSQSDLKSNNRQNRSRLYDQGFKVLALTAGGFVCLVILLIALNLLFEAIPSLRVDNVNFLTSSVWDTTNALNLRFGILDLLKVTVLSSVFALALAVPIAIGIATFLVSYAPARMSRPLGAVVDLLAAVPSIIFGLWGMAVLGPRIQPVADFLNSNLGWFFLFADGNVSSGTIFTAGIVLAIMILPIITSISREVLQQTPTLHKEAALALGATKWEMLRMTSFPYARSGMIAASMLALGRALGETVAVLIILRAATSTSGFSLFDGGYTFASKIASGAGEFNQPLPTGAYIAAGLVLFLLTFVVNALARVLSGGKVNG